MACVVALLLVLSADQPAYAHSGNASPAAPAPDRLICSGDFRARFEGFYQAEDPTHRRGRFGLRLGPRALGADGLNFTERLASGDAADVTAWTTGPMASRAVALNRRAVIRMQQTNRVRRNASVAPATPPMAQASSGGEQGESTYDKIWKFAKWYENGSNPVVQRVLFSGRYQHEYAWINADEGDLQEWNVRRLRLGPRVTLFRTFILHGEVELNPQEADPLYVRVTDLYVQWSPSGRFALAVGKQGVPFTMDGSTSSKELLAIDRSNVANNIWFPQEYIPGVSVSGRLAPWIYRAGVYSAGEANRELGRFNGGAFTLGVLGYDLAQSLGVKEALLAANYVYQHPDRRNTFTRQLEHIVSINFKFEADTWGFRTDVSAASGYLGQSELWGMMAMPFVNLTDKLQFVGRYTFVESDDPNGVRLATYESRLVSGRGDRYQELYVGINYFFYGHKLKLQSGVQFADMSDRANDGGVYSGVSWTSGVRVGW